MGCGGEGGGGQEGGLDVKSVAAVVGGCVGGGGSGGAEDVREFRIKGGCCFCWRFMMTVGTGIKVEVRRIHFCH